MTDDEAAEIVCECSDHTDVQHRVFLCWANLLATFGRLEDLLRASGAKAPDGYLLRRMLLSTFERLVAEVAVKVNPEEQMGLAELARQIVKEHVILHSDLPDGFLARPGGPNN